MDIVRRFTEENRQGSSWELDRRQKNVALISRSQNGLSRPRLRQGHAHVLLAYSWKPEERHHGSRYGQSMLPLSGCGQLGSLHYLCKQVPPTNVDPSRDSNYSTESTNS